MHAPFVKILPCQTFALYSAPVYVWLLLEGAHAFGYTYIYTEHDVPLLNVATSYVLTYVCYTAIVYVCLC